MIREPRVDELEKLANIGVEHAKDAGLLEHDQLERSHFKQQLREMMISPDYKIFVKEEGSVFSAYAVGCVTQKLWNSTLHGEMILFFVHPEVRNKYLADDLYNVMQDWFVETGCVYMQASCLMYDKDYLPNEPWLHRATTYFKTKGLSEVGYHYVEDLEQYR